MRNRFNLNESEKNRIRGLHGINTIKEQTNAITRAVISILNAPEPMGLQEAVDIWNSFIYRKTGCCPSTDLYKQFENECPKIIELMQESYAALGQKDIDLTDEMMEVLREGGVFDGENESLERQLVSSNLCTSLAGEVKVEVEEGPLVDKYLKSQGITDINEQTKTGDQVAAETEALQGISLNMLNPITQQYLSKGTTMNVYQIMMMLAGCHEDNETSPYSILSPMQLSSSSNDNPMVSFDNKKFCLIYKNGGAVCFDNVCKLGPNSSSWTQHKNWRYVQSDLVPALKKYMKGSTIDNGYVWQDDDTTSDNYLTGGEMLRWTTTDDSINAKWKLTKAVTT